MPEQSWFSVRVCTCHVPAPLSPPARSVKQKACAGQGERAGRGALLPEGGVCSGQAGEGEAVEVEGGSGSGQRIVLVVGAIVVITLPCLAAGSGCCEAGLAWCRVRCETPCVVWGGLARQ